MDFAFINTKVTCKLAVYNFQRRVNWLKVPHKRDLGQTLDILWNPFISDGLLSILRNFVANSQDEGEKDWSHGHTI